MKKLLALVLAVVLSLGLASVAFAAEYGAVQMTNNVEDEKATYHIPNDFSAAKRDVLTLWACFDGDTQSATILTGKDLASCAGLRNEKGELIDFAKATKWAVRITENAQYVAKLTVEPITWTNEDTGVVAVLGFDVTILPIDYVIAENRTVKAEIIAYDNNALTTTYIWACNLEIELRNHYVDVFVQKAGAAVGTPVWNNGSTTGYKHELDMNNAVAFYKIGESIILHRHYGSTNSSEEPSYVVYTEQFDTITKPGAVSFEYTGKAKVELAEPAFQKGINFKYNETNVASDLLTKAQIYANPDVNVYAFKFLSTATLDSKTVVTLDQANTRAALGYSTQKEQPVVLYYSADEGATWTKVGDGDLAKGAATYTLEKGNVLGWYLLSTGEINFGTTEGGKENVGTGASDMVSVCVALAVVSLVAAGAVCVKKVSK